MPIITVAIDMACGSVIVMGHLGSKCVISLRATAILGNMESSSGSMQQTRSSISTRPAARIISRRMTYVLRIAKMKVPHGKLQLTELVTFVLMAEYLVALQGALEPWRFGLVRTATAIKAPTNRRSRTMNNMRSRFEPVPLIVKLRAIAMSVYKTAAARMPSTAPLEREARPARLIIFRRRTEKRIREVREERNWKTRSRR